MVATDREVTPEGPRSRKGARTRARLVHAGKEVFAEQGLLDAPGDVRQLQRRPPGH